MGAGVAIPIGNYGSKNYNLSLPPTYVGFASTGIGLNTKAEIAWHGWGFNLSYISCQLPFYATGFLNENANGFVLGSEYWRYGQYISSKIVTNGNYFYNNYTFQIGISKTSSQKKKFITKFCLSIGEIFINLPMLNGSLEVVDKDSAKQNHTSSYNWSTEAYHSTLPTLNLSVQFNYLILPKFFVNLDFNALVALNYAQFNQIGEVTSNNSFSNIAMCWTSTNVDIFGIVLGLAYQF